MNDLSAQEQSCCYMLFFTCDESMHNQTGTSCQMHGASSHMHKSIFTCLNRARLPCLDHSAHLLRHTVITCVCLPSSFEGWTEVKQLSVSMC